jgi:hypothetical protein
MKRILIPALIALGLTAAACGTVEDPKSDAGQSVSDERLAAFDVCKQFVSDKLKSPGSAKFRNPLGDQVTYSGDGEGPITVTASVDSENSFSASLRSMYTCTVTHASGDRWHLEDLSLN